MSYDIDLTDPITGEVVQFSEKHQIRGGTYVLGGDTRAWLKITYNYSPFYREHIHPEQGIRWLYGKSAAETFAVLEKAIAALGTETSEDYWAPTPGNAGAALAGLLEFARRRPDGIWKGD